MTVAGQAKLHRLLKEAHALAKDLGKEDSATLSSPEAVVALFLYEMALLEQEEMWVCLLDSRNRLINRVQVYKGSLNSTAIRIGEVFREAVRQNAASVIFVHNHPSGDATPSPEDIKVTHAMYKAGELLDIAVLDHIIVGKGTYISLKAKGLFPGKVSKEATL